MPASPSPSLPRGVEGGDPELARRLSKLPSVLEVAKPLTAERRLDRLLEGVVDVAARVGEADRCTLFRVEAGVSRATPRAA
jgi:hypothetical protein